MEATARILPTVARFVLVPFTPVCADFALGELTPGEGQMQNRSERE